MVASSWALSQHVDSFRRSKFNNCVRLASYYAFHATFVLNPSCLPTLVTGKMRSISTEWSHVKDFFSIFWYNYQFILSSNAFMLVLAPRCGSRCPPRRPVVYTANHFINNSFADAAHRPHHWVDLPLLGAILIRKTSSRLWWPFILSNCFLPHAKLVEFVLSKSGIPGVCYCPICSSMLYYKNAKIVDVCFVPKNTWGTQSPLIVGNAATVLGRTISDR
jgi:hypothetical protein